MKLLLKLSINFLVVNHGMRKIDTELGDRLDWAINQQLDGLFIRISNSYNWLNVSNTYKNRK